MEPRDGANYPDVGDTTPLAIRHAFVLGPSPDEDPLAEGSDAAIYLSLVNQSAKADQLVSATSPDAEEVALTSEGKEGGLDLPAPAAGREEADPVPVGQPPYSDDSITLTGLSRDLRSGSTVRITFQFRSAGDITMKLPVVPRTAHRETLSPAVEPTPSESPSDAESTPASTEHTTTDEADAHG